MSNQSVTNQTDERVIAIYTRVSTKQQAAEGVSLDNQEAELRPVARETFPQRAVELFPELGASARAGKKRPEYERLLEAIRSNRVHAVLALKPDRLARSVSEYLALIQLCSDHGVILQTKSGGTVETNALGKLVAGLLALVAEFESDLRSERVKDATGFLAANGYYSGGKPPWGYKVGTDRILTPSLDAHLIRAAFEMYASGATMHRVYRFLAGSAKQEREVVTLDYVSKLLRNAHYAGWIVTKTKSRVPERFEGRHESIVPRDLFQRVQTRLAENRERGYRGQTLSPFGRVARCGKCGASLVVKQLPDDKGGYTYLRCSANGARGCGLKAIPVEHLELWVLGYLGAMPSLIDAALASGDWREWLGSVAERDRIEGELARAERVRREVIKLVRSGRYNADEADEELAATDREIRRLRPLYERLNTTTEGVREELERLRDLIDHGFNGDNLSQLWQHATRDQKELALTSILDKVELGNEALALRFKFGPFAGKPILLPLDRERRSARHAKSFQRLGLGIRATSTDRITDATRTEHRQPGSETGVDEANRLANNSRQARPGQSGGRSRSPLCGARPAPG